MTLRDRLQQPEEAQRGDLRDSDEKITIYLGKNNAGIEVEAYHDNAFKFLRHMVDIFADVTDKIECDTGEKMCLLNDWLDSLKNLKDKWFEEFNHDVDDESD